MTPTWHRPALALAISLTFAALATAAEPSFPKLSGRVVDGANVLSAGAEQSLAAQLQAHEQATGNQLVVVTMKDIQGWDIAEYGYLLGRHWDIGQKDKNNGVLLILASEERKVRIEVGYGLEGQLTDAVSSNIISTIILPSFRKGQFEPGLLQGSEAIIQALGGQYQMRRSGEKGSNSKNRTSVIAFFVILALQFGSALLPGRRGRRGRGLMFLPLGLGGGSSGSFGGGGFSGGGGSFGGGGASGGW